jgi:hypothetical protein
MAAGLQRFSFSRAVVWLTLESSGAEFGYGECRAVLTELRREGGWFLRLFDRSGGLLQKLEATDSTVDRGSGTVSGAGWSANVRRVGGCNCG